MVTNMISQSQESFPLRRAAGSFEISFTKWLRGAKTVRLPVTFSMSCQIFTSILFPSLKNIQEDLPKKKSCVLCRNFISIYKINRTLHGCLGIRILSFRAESLPVISFVHSWEILSALEIEFVSPHGHVISSIYQADPCPHFHSICGTLKCMWDRGFKLCCHASSVSADIFFQSSIIEC